MLGETMTTTEESVVREVHHLEKGADNSKVEKLITIFVNLLIFFSKIISGSRISQEISTSQGGG